MVPLAVYVIPDYIQYGQLFIFNDNTDPINKELANIKNILHTVSLHRNNFRN